MFIRDLSSAQAQTNAALDSAILANTKITGAKIKREHDEIAAFDLYSPIIETYIQEIKFSQAMGTVPKSDIYFLGQADCKGRLRVHSLTANHKSGSLLWSFNPAGFLQMIYIDRGAFDRAYYRFNYRRRGFWVKCDASFLTWLQRQECGGPVLSGRSGLKTRILRLCGSTEYMHRQFIFRGRPLRTNTTSTSTHGAPT